MWLEDCKQPTCDYQIFVDKSEDFASTSINNPVVAYPKQMRNDYAYSSFGYRGRYQMEWAINNADFDWIVKLDDDGYLCIDTLMHTLRDNGAPKMKFLFGR